MATSSSPAKAPRSDTKTLVALTLFATAAIGGIGAAGYLLMARPAVAAAPVVAQAPAPIFVPLEPWTVNLQSEGRNRFLHVGVTLKVADVATQDRIAQYLPELRSRVLTLLSNRDPATLASADDKARLADEIAAAVNRPFATTLPEQRVTQVMFTAFVLQ